MASQVAAQAPAAASATDDWKLKRLSECMMHNSIEEFLRRGPIDPSFWPTQPVAGVTACLHHMRERNVDGSTKKIVPAPKTVASALKFVYISTDGSTDKDTVWHELPMTTARISVHKMIVNNLPQELRGAAADIANVGLRDQCGVVHPLADGLEGPGFYAVCIHKADALPVDAYQGTKYGEPLCRNWVGTPKDARLVKKERLEAVQMLGDHGMSTFHIGCDYYNFTKTMAEERIRTCCASDIVIDHYYDYCNWLESSVLGADAAVDGDGNKTVFVMYNLATVQPRIVGDKDRNNFVLMIEACARSNIAYQKVTFIPAESVVFDGKLLVQPVPGNDRPRRLVNITLSL